MAEYNNTEGWEASPKTRRFWRFIPMPTSKNHGFEMPALFKGVNPIIRLLYVGFIGIFLLEGYATFAVAMTEGVPIEIITLLLFVDIFLAVLPHMLDGKRRDLKNLIFIGEYSAKYLNLDQNEITTFQANYIANKNKLAFRNFIKFLLYVPIVISAYAKLYLFFGQYPFFDTYQAYIVFISYSLGCVLHILCTGYVLMYWRFRFSLKRDQSRFANSNGKINKIEPRPDKLIKVKDNVKFILRTEQQTSNQSIALKSITMKDSKYFVHYQGILFDEEIIELVSQQNDLDQQIAVALTGKIIQINLLDIGRPEE